MKIILFVCGLFLTSNIFASNESGSFEIKFGSLTDTKEKTFINEEYSQIKSIPVSEGGKFGFSISPSQKKTYKFYTVSYLPNSPKKLSGVMNQANPADYSSGIKSAVGTASEDMIVRFTFDQGDPLGIYNIDLYINDEKAKSVKFNVISGK